MTVNHRVAGSSPAVGASSSSSRTSQEASVNSGLGERSPGPISSSSRTRRGVGRKPFTKSAHERVEQHDDVAAREAPRASRRALPASSFEGQRSRRRRCLLVCTGCTGRAQRSRAEHVVGVADDFPVSLRSASSCVGSSSSAPSAWRSAFLVVRYHGVPSSHAKSRCEVVPHLAQA